MILTLFPKNDAVFQHDNAPIHTAGTVHSWFEKHDGELQHLPRPPQSPYLNIIEPLWPVLETRVRNRFPPRTSIRNLKVFSKKAVQNSASTVQNLYKLIPRRTAAVLKAKCGSMPY
jgi:transposase